MKYILQERYQLVTRGNIKQPMQLDYNYEGSIMKLDDEGMATQLYISFEESKWKRVENMSPYPWYAHDPEMGFTCKYFDSLEELVADKFIEWL